MFFVVVSVGIVIISSLVKIGSVIAIYICCCFCFVVEDDDDVVVLSQKPSIKSGQNWVRNRGNIAFVVEGVKSLSCQTQLLS